MTNSVQKIPCSFCALETQIFSVLTSEEYDYLKKNSEEVIFFPGETILKQGAPVNNVLFFTYGLAKSYVEINVNQKLIIQLYKKSDIVAVPGVYFENINHFTLTAIENSRVRYFDWTRFKELLQSNQLFNNGFLEYLNKNHVKTLERMINLYKKQSRGKVAEVILCLSNTIYRCKSFKLTMSMSDIAQLAGISKEGVFKIIKEFTEASLISINNKNFEILNIDRLKEICEKG